MLTIFGGLPGSGKTTMAKALATKLRAVYLRIDTIEQRMRDMGFSVAHDEGYQVAFSLALDNLNNGLSVIADSTNPVHQSRAAWRNVAKMAQADFIEIEIICSDKAEHRRRIEQRTSDIPNLVLPRWQDVVARAYDPWLNGQHVIDTAGRTIEQSHRELYERLNICS